MQRNKVIKIVKEMVLAPSTKESKSERPDGADQILLAKSANRMHRAITNLSVFVPSLRIVQILSSTKTQTAGLKELSYIGLNISDIQVIIKYYRTLQYK